MQEAQLEHLHQQYTINSQRKFYSQLEFETQVQITRNQFEYELG